MICEQICAWAVDTMQEVEEVWRDDHLKEEHRENEVEKNDYEIQQLVRESKEKNDDIYDAPDSEDSLNNIPDDVLPQYVEEHKSDHENKFFTIF